MDTIAGAGFEIVPMDGPLGAEIRGLDAARPMAAATLAAFEAAWNDHLVLLLRGQSLDDDRLVAFSRQFGELDPPSPSPYTGEPFLPSHPELNVISNVVEGGRHLGTLGDGEAVWHADLTYADIPPKGAILYALEVPPDGGDTYFADMFAAYAALPADLKQAIDGKVAVHDAAHNSAGMLRRGYTETADVTQTPGARHPLVRTEPGTGRKALFLGRRPRSWIVGIDVADSDVLLDALWAHIADPRFAVRHRWRPGDMLMWLNLCVLHRRDAFDGAARRIMHRSQIRGTERIA
jgi:taurine dioxygenase